MHDVCRRHNLGHSKGKRRVMKMREEARRRKQKRRGGAGEGKPLWSSLSISRRKVLYIPEVPYLQNQCAVYLEHT